jgi:hypothetical protein
MPDRSVEVHPGVSIFCLASANEQPQNVLGKLKPEPPQLWHTSNAFAKAPPGQSPTGVGGEAAGGVPVVPVEYQVKVVSLAHFPNTSVTGRGALREGCPPLTSTIASGNHVGGHQGRPVIPATPAFGTETAIRQVVVAALPSVNAALRYW